MYAKLYFMTWAIFLAIIGLLLVTGNFTPIVSVWIGFIAFGMVFMGMISVLPSTVHEAHEPKPLKTGPNKLEAVVGSTSQAIRNIGADLAASSTIDVRKPKHP